MNLYDLTKKYGSGKGEEMMWKTLHIVSDFLEENLDEKQIRCLMRDLYGVMSSGHYNQEYALSDVEKMYYTDEDGKKHLAPYWSEEQVRKVYDQYKRVIPQEYNFWDFYVTLNMIKSDNCPLLMSWFPDATTEEYEKRLIELSINYLKDDDNPFGTEKVWGYLTGKR